jgi:hypothetical protein
MPPLVLPEDPIAGGMIFFPVTGSVGPGLVPGRHNGFRMLHMRRGVNPRPTAGW